MTAALPACSRRSIDDVPRQFGGEQCKRFPHDFLDVHRNPLADSAAAEREDAFDQRVAALAGDHDVLDIAAQPTAGADVPKRHLAITQYRAKEIVEVVRDAAGKRTERFQALSLAQLAAPTAAAPASARWRSVTSSMNPTMRVGLPSGSKNIRPFACSHRIRAAGVQHPVLGIDVAASAAQP